MRERRCVYTVLTGGYEHLLEQHVARQFDTDLICFTDGAIPEGSGWQERRIELTFPADANRSSRRPKMLPHEHLDGYDASLYIDNNVLLTVDPATIFDALLPPGVGMAALAHSFRATVRDEFAEVVLLGKDSAWVCDEQLQHYEATDPHVLDLRPIAGGFLLRRHDDEHVQRAMQRWWEHVLRYSRRDQLSLLAATRAVGLEILVHEVDNHLSPYHEWPRWGHRDPAGGAPVLTAPDDRIRALEGEVSALRAELEGERIRGQEAVLAAIEAVRADFHRSLSWRATAPLRAAGDAVRRRRSGPAQP